MNGASKLVHRDWRRMKKSALYAWTWIAGSVSHSGPPLIQRSGKEPGSGSSVRRAVFPALETEPCSVCEVALGLGTSVQPSQLRLSARALKERMVDLPACLASRLA